MNLAETAIPLRNIGASGVLWRNEGDLVSIVNGDSKVIWSMEDDSLQSFDLSSDPGERSVIEPLTELAEAAGYYWSTPPEAVPSEVNYGETASRELRNLGYIR